MKALKIGELTFERAVFLAPMAGVTDRYYRKICSRHAASAATTEMISAKALCYEQRSKKNAPCRTAPLAYIEPDGIPTAVQIFGSDPGYMAEAAAMLAEGNYRGFDGALPYAIDINMGCPVKKVVSCGEGSALMKTPELAGKIVEAVKAAVRLPVTVKIRAGWSKNNVTAPEFACILESAGADAVCVHGRTRDQFYAPSSSNEVIAAVKDAVKIPVIGNGDVYSANDALRMISETHCDGIAVGRGALGNPWIFEEINAALDGKEYVFPSPRERISEAIAHTRYVVSEKGERGVIEARNQLSWYTKGIRGGTAARNLINSAKTLEEMEKVLNELVITAESEDTDV